MKHIKSRWMASALGVLLAASLLNVNAADKQDKEKDKQQPKQNQGTQKGGSQGQGNPGGGIPNRPQPKPGNPGQEDPNRSRPGQLNPTPGRTVPEQPAQPPPKVEPRKVEQLPPAKDTTPGKETKPTLKDTATPGKEAKPPAKDTNPLGKDATPPGKETKAPAKDTAPSGKDAKSPVKDTNPLVKDTAPAVKGPQPPPTGPKLPSTSVPPPVRPTLTKVQRAGGVTEERSADGKLRSITKLDQKTGEKRSQQLATTGRVEKEEVTRRDGSKEIKELDLGNRERKRTVVHADKKVETTDVHYNRTGDVRSRETVVTDARGVAVSKTVVVKQNIVIKNTTIVNNTYVERHYRPCRWGYVYRPVIIAPAVYVGWYDPYWYGPVRHHFTFSWGWYSDPWYRYHAYYWEPYPVYAAPSYWVTDWMVAGYLADRYAVATSVEQTRVEVDLAREEARKAREAAEQAKDAAERAEAEAEKAKLEARLARAEERLAKAELSEEKRKERGDQPNANAAPITKETKDTLREQVENTIAEKKAAAEKGGSADDAALPDVAVSLKDPKRIYPVSKNISVTRAEDNKAAGTLTPGDLLKVAPGQEATLKGANEGTLVNMVVITSKGDDDSVPAGTVIAVPLKELQEFDNEFRAKIDLGIAEADKNKDDFRKNAAAK